MLCVKTIHVENRSIYVEGNLKRTSHLRDRLGDKWSNGVVGIKVWAEGGILLNLQDISRSSDHSYNLSQGLRRIFFSSISL